jgi:hypothetical protein
MLDNHKSTTNPVVHGDCSKYYLKMGIEGAQIRQGENLLVEPTVRKPGIRQRGPLPETDASISFADSASCPS